ncbi:hypothetical protein BX616_003789 [Lobosporangium transversale]|nr:hypothetical protein BX616_003789 [Lobosporangium transversale]
MDLTSLEDTSVEPQLINGLEWEPLFPIIDKEIFRHDPVYNELSRSPIHHLLVTTKAYHTVDAIAKIRHRLRPWTTIVLMQNGMGIHEEICESMGWTDENERPIFMQGIISHGAQKLDDTIVHTGRGSVWLAPLLDGSKSTGSDEVSEAETEEGAPLPSSMPSLTKLLSMPVDETTLFPSIVRPDKNTLYTPYPFGSPAPFSARFTNAPFSTFYTAPTVVRTLRALRTRSLYEALIAFDQLSDAMNLRILMPDHLLALQLSKVIVNACVNPVATLLESTNGGLLDSTTGGAHQAVKDLLKESHSILIQSKEYKDLPASFQKEYLSYDALLSTTEGILRATQQNRCSTLQDYLKGSPMSEIDYMNGYLIKMAEKNRKAGTDVQSVAPLNRMVTEKIKEKFGNSRKLSAL